MKGRYYLVAIAVGAGVAVAFWFGAMALFVDSTDPISNSIAPYVFGLLAILGGVGVTLFTGLMLFARERIKNDGKPSMDRREIS